MVPEEKRPADSQDTPRHKPTDYSDAGEAEVFTNACYDTLRYSPATDYLVYDGVRWVESDIRAQAALHKFTELQLAEATFEIHRTDRMMEENGAAELIGSVGKNRAVELFNDEQLNSYVANLAALRYRDFVIQHRNSKYITAVLKESRAMVEISPSELDADGFLLNTPDFTVDLRKGRNGAQPHKATDYITKCTAVTPGRKGEDIWKKALETFFCGDKELESYVQQIVGLATIGHVYVEALVIAYGDGRNGKSTFWNVLSRVMGSYAGNISADALTIGCKRNVKPELAEAKGKRLLIAAELEEGMRLSTSIVKQFCSTDEVFAEKKYKDPFSFSPSHTLVLYTNHLPKVGASDSGTWRRLIVIPFNACLEGKGDIKNYGDYLFENAGPAVLAWMIEGAEKAIKAQFHFPMPQCVRDAIAEYHESNDWLDHFISDECEVGDGFHEKSGVLYSTYRAYATKMGEYPKGTADFYSALFKAGFKKRRNNSGRYITGLRLKPFDDGMTQ